MNALRNILTHTKPALAVAITTLLGSLALPLPVSASANTVNSSSPHGPLVSPMFWAGTNCYNLISANGDWARFCISVNVSDWTEAKQGLVTFTSYSGNFSFLRVDGLDLNKNEQLIQSKGYMGQYLNSTNGYFSTNWSYTFWGDYSAAVNMPCVKWQNGGWACAQPTWYESATEPIL